VFDYGLRGPCRRLSCIPGAVNGVASMRISDPNSGQNGQTVTGSSSGGDVGPTDAVAVCAVDAHPLWIEERARIAVNRNVRVAGHLVFQEPIRIEGHFRGEVSSSELVVISEDASVGGRIRSPRLMVLGALEGDITASKSVVLGPHSRFKGKMEANSVTIAKAPVLTPICVLAAPPRKRCSGVDCNDCRK